MIKNKQININVYKDYIIEDWPCYWFTLEIRNRYNRLIEKYCKRLDENATDLTNWMKIKVKYIHYPIWIVLDIIIFKIAY